MDDDQELAPEHVVKHRAHKGQCGCAAHAQGVCPRCGHLFFVHGKDGCMYSVNRFDGTLACNCPQARPLQPHAVPLNLK